eukprot:TRINITY_DN91_c3_g1_i1.p2 TRINITY_DN91_c3_g1~~TRINITY_DN91_c3_g1_i1.p2  ORF type:complete len:192 (-),score=32.06 TRINITY_DN91_c3_g1_i1:108-683(-)
MQWLVTIIVSLDFCCVGTFMNFSEKLLAINYGYKTEQAGFITSIINSSAFILSPLFGFVLDKIGHRGHAVLVSSYGLVIAFSIFSLSQDKILMYISMSLIGFSFSLISAGLWPCIPLLVEKNAYGAAFGIMGAGINTSSLLVNYFLGYLINKNEMYYATLVWFFLSFLSVLFCIWWNVLDFKKGGKAQKHF